MASSEETKALRVAITREIADIAKISVENARKLEAYLFSAASSLEAYGDRGTLRERLKDVVRRLKEKKGGQSSSKESPPKDTIVKDSAEVIDAPPRSRRRPFEEESPFMGPVAKSRRIGRAETKKTLEDLTRLEDEVLGLMRTASDTVAELQAAPSCSASALAGLAKAFTRGLTAVHEGLRAKSGILQAVPVLGQGDYISMNKAMLPTAESNQAKQVIEPLNQRVDIT